MEDSDVKIHRWVAERCARDRSHGQGYARGLQKYANTGSGASRDFGPAKAPWRIEDPQAANPKCLISTHFPSLTRVTLGASAVERRTVVRRCTRTAAHPQ